MMRVTEQFSAKPEPSMKWNEEPFKEIWRFPVVWRSGEKLKQPEWFLVATLVLAHGKALALTLRIVLIVVLALAWRLVGTLNQVGAVVSGVRAALIVAVLALLRYRWNGQQGKNKYCYGKVLQLLHRGPP